MSRHRLRWPALATTFLFACSSPTTTRSTEQEVSTSSSIDAPSTTQAAETEPEVTVPIVSTRLSVGMTRSFEYLAARAHLLQYPGQEVSARLVAGDSECRLEGSVVVATDSGECRVSLTSAGRTETVALSVSPAPERSDVDRPGGNVLDLKPVYIRLADSPDMERDTNGQIATFAQSISDFVAAQHPGFALRVDTFGGVPDVQHIQLPITTAEFLDRWNRPDSVMKRNIGPLGELLLEHGIDAGFEGFYNPRTLGSKIDHIDRILVGIVEAPRGAYGSANNNTPGGCGSSTGNAFVVYFVRDLAGGDCTSSQQIAFDYAGSSTENWIGYDAFRLTVDILNGNRDCDRVITSRYAVPLDDRPSSITSPRDPIGYPYAVGSSYPKLLDPMRKFYFQISSGDFVGDPCTDIIYSPYLTDWFSTDVHDDDIDGRSTVDRPDDSADPQVRVLYVLPSDGFDRRWDVDGLIHAAAATANDWLFANGQKTVRFDTVDGLLDVGFVRLPVAESTLWLRPDGTKCSPDEMCPDPRRLASLLDEEEAITEGKIHIIVWGGQLMPASTRNVGCAGAMPDRQAVFMSPVLRMPNSNTVGCLPGVAAGVPESSNTLGLIMIHEIIHVVGGVDNEAPDADGGFHIVGDPFDLMGGSAGVVQLDPKRRNYWNHGNPALVDVSLSPFFDNSPSPMSARTFVVPEREWWMELPNGWSPLSHIEPSPGNISPPALGDASPPASSNISTAAESDCPVESDEVAAVFSGRLPLGSNVANEPVGLIWAKNPARCVAARVSSDSQGWFEIELPLDAHVYASWEEGGGYCVVWDENGDGRFDSFSSEPLHCISGVTLNSVVRIDVKR